MLEIKLPVEFGTWNEGEPQEFVIATPGYFHTPKLPTATVNVKTPTTLVTMIDSFSVTLIPHKKKP